MALIDEYKQAIQDVLDGRAKEPPRPSELPWSEDKAATMWAAAAAELIAEDSAGGGGGSGALVVNLTIDTGTKNATADKTAAEIWAAAQSGVVMFTGSTAYLQFEGTFMCPLVYATYSDDGYGFTLGGSTFDALLAATGSDYPAGELY